MTEREIRIPNRLGLHARAAARFVHLASEFRSQIRISCNGHEVDGKSILGILTLAAVQGALVRIVCDGDDEAEAAESLRRLVESRFGEDE